MQAIAFKKFGENYNNIFFLKMTSEQMFQIRGKRKRMKNNRGGMIDGIRPLNRGWQGIDV